MLYKNGAAAALEQAAAGIRRDRERFRPVFVAAERFFARRALVVAGDAGLAVLSPGEKRKVVYLSYLVYALRPKQEARALAEELFNVAPEGLTRHASAFARIPGEAYVVSVAQRPLFRLEGLPFLRRLRTLELLGAVRRRALFAPVEVLCLPPVLQLIRVYRALSDPTQAAEWPELRRAEVRLRAEAMRPEAERLRAEAMRPEAERPRAKRPAGKRGGRYDRRGEALKFAAGPGRALVSGEGGHVRAVTEHRLEEEAAHFRGAGVRTTISRVSVPGDRLLRRLTVYHQRVPFLHVYDAAAYELVPTRLVGQGAVALPYARGRFLLSELWALRLIAQLCPGRQTTAPARRIWKEYAEVARSFGQGPAALFSSRAGDYLGCYTDPVLRERARARAARKKHGFVPPHYPLRQRQEK